MWLIRKSFEYSYESERRLHILHPDVAVSSLPYNARKRKAGISASDSGIRSVSGIQRLYNAV